MIKKIPIAILCIVLLLAGCSAGKTAQWQRPTQESDNSAVYVQTLPAVVTPDAASFGAAMGALYSSYNVSAYRDGYECYGTDDCTRYCLRANGDGTCSYFWACDYAADEANYDSLSALVLERTGLEVTADILSGMAWQAARDCPSEYPVYTITLQDDGSYNYVRVGVVDLGGVCEKWTLSAYNTTI